MRTPRPWPGRLWWRLIKRRLPTSLFGRSLLIIVLPIVIMQIAVTYVFFDAHWQTVNSHLTEGLAGDVVLDPAELRGRPQPGQSSRGWPTAPSAPSTSRSIFKRAACLPRGRRPRCSSRSTARCSSALEERIDQPFWFDTDRYPAYVDVRVKVPEGVLRIIAPKDRVFATRGHIFILWLTIATVLLTGDRRGASSATRCGRSSGWPPPPTPSAAGWTSISSRTARARSARPPAPSWP